MNRPILYTSIIILSHVLLHAAQAQSGQRLQALDSYTVWQFPGQNHNSAKIVSDSLLSNKLLVKKGYSNKPLRLISPNTSLQIKNKTPLAIYSFPDSLIANPNYKKPFAVHPGGLKLAPVDPNAGSVDPGIFYNPAEPTEPASAILKPLKEVDPKMVFNPDKEQ